MASDEFERHQNTAFASAGGNSRAERLPMIVNRPRHPDPYQEAFQKQEAGFLATRLRAETLYVADLIRVLRPHSGGRRRWAVMQSIRGLRSKAGLDIPHKFEEAVESAFLQHCAGSDAFAKRSDADKAPLFHWPLGKTGGIWAVHPEKADAWLRDNA